MTRDDFGTERVSRILLHLAPPVMLAQLIQALYNIVDSFFVGRYSDAGLTALSIIYPLQLLMIALAVGTGVGCNSLISRRLGEQRHDVASQAASHGLVLALLSSAVFALLGFLFVKPFFAAFTGDA